MKMELVGVVESLSVMEDWFGLFGKESPDILSLADRLSECGDRSEAFVTFFEWCDECEPEDVLTAEERATLIQIVLGWLGA